MHPLKAAVLHHKLDEISSLAADTNALSESGFAEDLLRIAREMGNDCTITRVARVFPSLQARVDARSLLIQRLRALATNYFGGGSTEKAARRLWAQAMHGTVDPFSMDEPDFVLTPELLKDARFLLRRSSIASEDQLIALARSSGEA